MIPEERDSQPDADILERKRLLERPSRARYGRVLQALELRWRRRELEPGRMMREVVDALWDAFGGAPYSWAGFYVLGPEGKELVLGPHRDKPATTPLPLHGVCGKALRTGLAQVVPDVSALGEAHIACDPSARSEIALPVLDKDGKAWGVLDIDSAQASAFDEMDQRWLERILRRFGELGRP